MSDSQPAPGEGRPPGRSAGAPADDEGGSLARRTAVMATGTVLSRLTGFLRVAAFGAAIGATEGPLADAYNKANTAPNLVYELVLGGVLASVLVPIFVETLGRDTDEHRHVTNTITTLAGAVLVAVSLIGVLAAPALAILFTLGEPAGAELDELRGTITLLLRLFMPQVLFYGLTTIWTAYLNAHRHFAAPMFVPALNNVVVSAILLAFGALVSFEAVTDLSALSFGLILLLGAGTTAGIVAMTVPLWPIARRRAWRFRPSFDWRHPMVRRVGRLGGWTVLYVITNQIALLVVLVLAGATGEAGAYSAYVLAFVFFQLPHGIYAVSVMSALLPGMADAHAAGDTDRFRRELSRGVRATALLIVPAAVGLAALSAPLVRLLMERGAFGAASTALVAAVLVAFACGLPAFSMSQLFLRAHYGLQDTRTPVIVNVAKVAVHIAVMLVLFVALDGTARVVGLAVGHAVGYWVATVLYALRLRRRLEGIGGRALAGVLARIGAAAALMGVVVLVTAGALAARVDLTALTGQITQVGVAVVLGALAYLVVARLLGVPELRGVIAAVRRR